MVTVLFNICIIDLADESVLIKIVDDISLGELPSTVED